MPTRRTLAAVLGSLPLVEDDVYLQMQATNLDVVDQLMRPWEDRLAAEYVDQGHTPLSTFLPVAAFSQLWIFGVYELLRTWRQRCKQALEFSDRFATSDQRTCRKPTRKENDVAPGAPADPTGARASRTAARSRRARGRIQKALDRSERPFRRIEALRVTLAKHEIPRSKSSSVALAPGLGGVDSVSGSVFWFVDLGRGEVDQLSRRAVADMLLTLTSREPLPLLPKAIQDLIGALPARSYGIKEVVLVLSSGAAYRAFVAWDKEVVWVPGAERLPFKTSDVVDARAVSSMGTR
jgi:hypothetical protein